MKYRTALVLAGIILLLPIIAGCTPSGGKPICPTGSLMAPIQTDPPMWSVVDSLSPTLHWLYPDESCNPQGYAIRLKTGPFFTDSLGGGTGNPSTSWSPGSPLLPGKEYSWGVQAINGTSLGPYAGSRYFFTGPMCETDALVAPVLLQPAYNSEITDLNPSLIWEYPNPCLPHGYRVDLSKDITFADTSLSGGTGNPSTRWGPGDPLEDCTVYFWKISPINDTTLGPASEIFAFRTNTTGSCPTPTPVGPTATPVNPTFTPTPVEPTFTPTPVPAFFYPNFNAYCRQGDDTSFPWFDIAMKGSSYPLDGRNFDNTWLRIMISNDRGCWVLASSGSASLDTFKLRVLARVPTPTPTPVVNCRSFTAPSSCELHPTCKWYSQSTAAPYCGNR